MPTSSARCDFHHCSKPRSPAPRQLRRTLAPRVLRGQWRGRRQLRMLPCEFSLEEKCGREAALLQRFTVLKVTPAEGAAAPRLVRGQPALAAPRDGRGRERALVDLTESRFEHALVSRLQQGNARSNPNYSPCSHPSGLEPASGAPPRPLGTISGRVAPHIPVRGRASAERAKNTRTQPAKAAAAVGQGFLLRCFSSSRLRASTAAPWREIEHTTTA